MKAFTIYEWDITHSIVEHGPRKGQVVLHITLTINGNRACSLSVTRANDEKLTMRQQIDKYFDPVWMAPHCYLACEDYWRKHITVSNMVITPEINP
jgi:hypothetical protein